MVTTINSLPSEIILSILEIASGKRLNQIQLGSREARKPYYLAAKCLQTAALISKSCTIAAQDLLFQSVILDASRKDVLSFYSAPLDQLIIRELSLHIYDDSIDCIEGVLSRVNGVQVLKITNHSKTNKSFDVSALNSSGLSKLKQISLSNISILNRRTTRRLPFRLQTLDVNCIIVEKSVLPLLMTPSLIHLSIMQLAKHPTFLEGLGAASSHIRTFYFECLDRNTLDRYVPIFSSCIYVNTLDVKLSWEGILVPLVSAFPPNQLLQLTLRYGFMPDTFEDILAALSQSSTSNLRTLNMIGYCFIESQYETDFITLRAECAKRKIQLNLSLGDAFMSWYAL